MVLLNNKTQEITQNTQQVKQRRVGQYRKEVKARHTRKVIFIVQQCVTKRQIIVRHEDRVRKYSSNMQKTPETQQNQQKNKNADSLPGFIPD